MAFAKSVFIDGVEFITRDDVKEAGKTDLFGQVALPVSIILLLVLTAGVSYTNSYLSFKCITTF